jgi:hypothetical protein
MLFWIVVFYTVAILQGTGVLHMSNNVELLNAILIVAMIIYNAEKLKL